MTLSIPTDQALDQLEDAAPMLGDRAALDEFWVRNGYLFFRGVFSDAAVAPVREEIMRVLADNGYIEPDRELPIWTGRGLSGFGTRPEAIYGRNLAERFFETAEVKQLLREIIDDEPVFLPIEVYRFTPPIGADGVGEHMAPPHQDGFFNQGYNFRILWIPLMDVDGPTGGLAIAPGAYKRGLLHDPEQPPNFPIPQGALDGATWARADYHVGDLLMMHPATPHGGLPNVSTKLRLTMDLRIGAESDRCPFVGRVVSIDAEHLAVRARDGRERSFVLDDDTYVLTRPRTAVSRHEIGGYWSPGDDVIVAVSDADPGRASLVRKPSAKQYS